MSAFDGSSRALDLTSGPLLGSVVESDGSLAVVQVRDPSVLGRVAPADLVALPGRHAGERLIGMVESVARSRCPDPGSNGTHAAGEAGVVRAMLIGTLDAAPKGDVFKRGASSFPAVGSECHLIEGEVLRRFMSILGENVAADERLALGSFVAERGATAIADGNRLFQRHAAVLGSTGSGKSWTVALMLERASYLAHPNIIVFDMHGEYAPLTRGTPERPPVARGLRVAGPGDRSDSDDVLFVPYWLLDRDEALSLILDETDPDAPNQAIRFSDHVHKLKVSSLHEGGYEETAATVTVDSPVPYRLENLLAWLTADDEEKIVKQPSGDVIPGPYHGRLTRFISRLQARLADGRYAFMFNPPDECREYDWLVETAGVLLDNSQGPGIKIIDFSEVPTEAVPVVAGVLARLLYDIQFWTDAEHRTPLCFVCDEAHLYMPTADGKGPTHREALRAFEQIAKEGRKYGVGLMIVSQRPADVSRTVLAQCNNFVVLRLTNDQDQDVIAQLVPQTLARLTDVLPLLDVGEALLLGDALLLPTRVKLDPPSIAPASATRAFWNDWADQPSSAAAIVDGVEALRRQVRPSGWRDAVEPLTR
ncbi:MAG TPA: ATP-binding protein [Thermoleophilaceae bacterium]|nr:ATP-binding protein [Thermoleophilaceae bacterium]